MRKNIRLNFFKTITCLTLSALCIALPSSFPAKPLEQLFETTAYAAETNGIYTPTGKNGSNIRKGAGTSHSIITAIPKGAQVEITKFSGNWGYVDVNYYNGKTGWICMDYMEKSPSLTTSEGSSIKGFVPPLTYWKVTSPFGPRWGRNHNGIDLGGNNMNTPIYAAMDGTVAYVKDQGNKGYGKYLAIQHKGYTTLYAHCSSITVKPGTKVKAGQVIAKVGSTGNSTGPHLHFEITDKSGTRLDPQNFLFLR